MSYLGILTVDSDCPAHGGVGHSERVVYLCLWWPLRAYGLGKRSDDPALQRFDDGFVRIAQTELAKRLSNAEFFLSKGY